MRGGRRRLPRRGSLRARLGFEELIESPLPTQVGFGFLVKGKYTVLPGSPFSPPGTQELYGTSRPCGKLQSLLVKGVPQPFLTRLRLLPAPPGLSRVAKGARCAGQMFWKTPRAAGLESCLWMSGCLVLCCPLKGTCCLSRAEK